MPTPLDILHPAAEPVPDWLTAFQPGAPFPREAFFASRILYYPGSATDGHPLCVFGKAHAVHCFVYADSSFSKAELERQLTDEKDHEHPLGYRLVSLVDVSERELTPNGWTRHAAPPRDADEHFLTNRPPEGPFAVFAVLESNPDRGDDHGPKRLALLHIGGDGYATFDALFCQTGSRLPFAVLLQDHGFGLNWNREGFGGESLLWRLASQKGVKMPKWLFVATDNTQPWPGYHAVLHEPNHGGMHHVPRVLHTTRRRASRLNNYGSGHQPTARLSIMQLKRLHRENGGDTSECPLNQRTLAQFETTASLDDPGTPDRLYALAERFSCWAKEELVERLYRLAFAGYTRFLGADHRKTLLAADNLAGALNHRGAFEESATLFRQSLDVTERKYGPDHPSTVLYITHLAFVMVSKGEDAEAEALHRRALQLREKRQGAEHPDSIWCIINLATQIGEQGRPSEAVALLRTYSDKHETCRIQLRYTLACYECRLGNTETAKELIRQCLEDNLSQYDNVEDDAIEDERLEPIRDDIRTLLQGV